MRLGSTTTENKCTVKMLQHLVTVTIFLQLLRSQFLIDQNKKMLSSQHFHDNFTTNSKW